MYKLLIFQFIANYVVCSNKIGVKQVKSMVGQCPEELWKPQCIASSRVGWRGTRGRSLSGYSFWNVAWKPPWLAATCASVEATAEPEHGLWCHTEVAASASLTLRDPCSTFWDNELKSKKNKNKLTQFLIWATALNTRASYECLALSSMGAFS